MGLLKKKEGSRVLDMAVMMKPIDYYPYPALPKWMHDPAMLPESEGTAVVQDIFPSAELLKQSENRNGDHYLIAMFMILEKPVDFEYWHFGT